MLFKKKKDDKPVKTIIVGEDYLKEFDVRFTDRGYSFDRVYWEVDWAGKMLPPDSYMSNDGYVGPRSQYKGNGVLIPYVAPRRGWSPTLETARKKASWAAREEWERKNAVKKVFTGWDTKEAA